MHRTRNFVALFLLVTLAVVGLTTMQATFAQSIPKPSVPEFNVKYVDHSYDIPPTYGIDQYTGKTVETKQGEHIDNRTVEITIKNEPFTPYNDSNQNVIDRFYDVRYKGSFTETWNTMFANQTQVAGIGAANPYMEYGYAIQDYSAQYTTIIYRLTSQVSANGQIDFQVEALEGYTSETSYDAHIMFVYAGFTFYGQESGWSNTKTVSIGETIASALPTPLSTITAATAPTPAQTSTPTTAVPEIPTMAGLLLLFSMTSIAAIIRAKNKEVSKV